MWYSPAKESTGGGNKRRKASIASGYCSYKILGSLINYLYNTAMQYEWDEGKDEANIADGRLGFASVENFEWQTALIVPSDRQGERRWAAIGLIGNTLYHVVYTDRGDRRRIISLRMASRAERDRYVRERD